MSQEASTRKKLLLMSPMLHQGGFEKVCVETARLMEPFYDVTILIFTDKDLHYDVTGLKVLSLNLPSVQGKLNKTLTLLRRVRAARKVKQKERFDISYSFGSSANRVNALSRTTETVITGIRCSTDMENPKEIHLLCNRSDRVYSCSKDILHQLKTDYGYERGSFIYNPVDGEDLKKKAAQELPAELADKMRGKRTVITLGRDDIIKGHWHLIKAFALAAKEVPDARLVILGAGRFKKARALAEKLGIADRVIFGGNLTNPFPAVAASSLYVLASNHEGFPNALLEAMALGVPVIAADCKTGPREILLSEEALSDCEETLTKSLHAQYGVLVPDLGADEDYEHTEATPEEVFLAEEIRTLLTDETLRSTYAVNAEQGAGRFTKERYTEELKTLLEGACHG